MRANLPEADYNEWAGFFSFKPTEMLKWVLNSPCKITCLNTGNQCGKCISYRTLVSTPDGEVPVGELYDAGKPFRVYAYDGNKKVVAMAKPPIKKKGLHKCYEILMSDGQWCEPADYHRILTASGWRPVQRLYESFCSHIQIASNDVSYSPPLTFNGNRMISIKPIACQEVYDFEVPGYHNYFAGGIIHHNTDTAAMDMLLSVMGMHPNKHKNIKPEDTVRTLRFGSQTLPGEKEGDEVRNTQYPALMRRLPRTFIDKDITARRPVVSVKTPNGKNANIEFVSYSQEVQSTAGTQRARIWLDEESSRDFFEEQIPRLLAADGDVLITMTPVPGSIGWQFDLFYERAKYIYRTKAVRDRIYERTGELLPECEITESKDDICVIMAATDDNPIYEDLAKKRSEQTGKPVTAKEYVDTLFEMYDDEDVIDARRYGIFSQLSSKVYKSFTPAVHIISQQKYFPEGIPHDWKHYRGIDYHMNTPWACVWMSISPQNEAFVWCDYAANPAKMITYDIALGVAQRSGDYKYMLNLIDPLASTKQVNTNLSTIEDMNRYFVEFRKQDIGTGGHWQGWDTKGGRGREEFIKRMLNSIKVGKPFNNKVITGQDAMQRTELLPTVWITDNCRNVIESVKNWRFEEWKSREAFAKHEMKETTQKRWSHFPIAVECLFKNPMVSNAKWGDVSGAPKRPKQYFHVR